MLHGEDAGPDGRDDPLPRAAREGGRRGPAGGVLYLLGQCAEQRGQLEQAVEYYQRVFVIDIQFKDVGERLSALESARS
jgi:tetratricopeptide (TPR) repeat protein